MAYVAAGLKGHCPLVLHGAFSRNIASAMVFPVDAVVGLRHVVDAEARPRGAAAHVEDDAVVASAEQVRVDPVAERGKRCKLIRVKCSFTENKIHTIK